MYIYIYTQMHTARLASTAGDSLTHLRIPTVFSREFRVHSCSVKFF